jgi:PKD repeat protein
VQFTDTSTGSPASWQWSFGDGATSSLKNPSHTYAVAGTYGVTLIISANSSSSSKTETVTVGYANAIVAASPSLADVKAAIAKASPGDTVMVPAGSATWSSPLNILKPISLIGAGSSSTIITSGYNNTGDYLITYDYLSPMPDELFRLSGFKILCGNNCGALGIFPGSVNYHTSKIRVDHNYFSRTSDGRLVIVLGTGHGVIDNNEMHCNYYAVSIYGNQADDWLYTTFTPGTSENFFVEDNVFYTNDGVHASGQGGRYCIRYNTYYCSSGCHPWFDAHGNQTDQNMGTMGVEIYGNTISLSNGSSCTMFDDRGGEAIVFNNTINTVGSVASQIREAYSDYIVTPSTAPDGQPQYVSETYYWNNKWNTTLLTAPNLIYVSETIDYGGSIGVVPRENVHFWCQKASFNGSSGVGVGLLANRPSSGLSVGVGYWATDQNKLYRATSPTTWELYYTPYTYPHPLRQLN